MCTSSFHFSQVGLHCALIAAHRDCPLAQVLLKSSFQVPSGPETSVEEAREVSIEYPSCNRRLSSGSKISRLSFCFVVLEDRFLSRCRVFENRGD